MSEATPLEILGFINTELAKESPRLNCEINWRHSIRECYEFQFLIDRTELIYECSMSFENLTIPGAFRLARTNIDGAIGAFRTLCYFPSMASQLWQFSTKGTETKVVFSQGNNRIEVPLIEWRISFERGRIHKVFLKAYAQFFNRQNNKLIARSGADGLEVYGLLLQTYQEFPIDGRSTVEIEIRPNVVEAIQSIETEVSNQAEFWLNETRTISLRVEPVEARRWNESRWELEGDRTIRHWNNEPREGIGRVQLPHWTPSAEALAQLMQPNWEPSAEMLAQLMQPTPEALAQLNSLIGARMEVIGIDEAIGIDKPAPIPNICKGCANLYGDIDNGRRLICAMHPYGYQGEGEDCPDREQS